ncbi:MAG: hypothetical protein HY553_22660 [Elusimicrobia bacterium]|nr:hypothetical protein [Elusimicrobiota bacterium]
MRYFVYQDAQIMGPFTREDLGQVQGLHGDSLVCPEGSVGNKDTEWRSAREIGDLSTLFGAGPGLKAAPALELTAGGPPDFYDRLGEETRSILGGFGYAGEWTSGVFEDPDFFRHWGSLVDSATARSEELELAQIKTHDLEKNLDIMGEKLARYERQQNEILERLNQKDRALEEKRKAMEAMENRLPQLEKALEAAREELRQARARLGELQRGAVPQAWQEAPGAQPPAPAPAQRRRPPVPEPEPEVDEIPEPAPEPRRPEPRREFKLEPPPLPEAPPPAPARRAPPPVERAPEAEPYEPTRSELLLPRASEAAAPPPPPAPAPAPVRPAPSPRPTLTLPAPIKLKASTLEAKAALFTPPIPKAAPQPAPAPEPVVDLAAPAAVDAPAPSPVEAVAPVAAPPPLEAPAPAAIAAEAPAESAPPVDAGPPLTAPSIVAGSSAGIEPLPEGILVTGWGDLSVLQPPPPVAAPAPAAQELPALTPPPALEAPAGEPVVAAAGPLPAEPEPQPIVFSPEPAQPPETLVRRSPGAEPGADPSPWGLGPSEPPGPELAPIPAPEPMPSVPAGLESPSFGAAAPGAAPPGIVELTITPPSEGAGPSPFERAPTNPPARLEPVGALDRPHTMVRSVAAPPETVPPGDAPFPSLSTPAPVAAPGAPSKIPSRPAPAPETAPQTGAETMQRRRQSKTFLVGLGVAFTGLLATGVFFLKDPKAVIQLFTMSPKKNTPAVDPDDLAGPPPTSLSQVKPHTPAFPAREPGAGPTATAPQPSAAPSAAPAETPRGRDYVADNMVAAIDFAKQQPVAKSRQKLGSWLTATLVRPGDEEEWSAGAVEATIYLVSYRYFKGGRAAKQEPMTYLFEVDLDKKAIKGRNPLAKDLLAGAAKAGPAKPAKKAKKARRAAPDAPPQAAEEEETPPPLDDLIGPASQEPMTPGAELTGE